MSKNLALDNHNLIPDFGTVFSNLVPANTIYRYNGMMFIGKYNRST